MEAYLAQFNFSYAGYLGNRYANGANLPDRLMHLLDDDAYYDRFENGGDLPEDKYEMMKDTIYQERFIKGHEIDEDMKAVLYKQDYRDRYKNGHDLLESETKYLNDDDHRLRFEFGHDVAAEDMCAIWPINYHHRYQNGYDIPEEMMKDIPDDVYRARYLAGHEIPSDKMQHFADEYHEVHYESGGDVQIDVYYSRHRVRFENGYTIPADKMHVITAANKYHRLRDGFDPENRPYRLSYLLGFNLPPHVKLDLMPSDRAIHQNLELNEACILALAGVPFAIPREFAADFEYIMGYTIPREFAAVPNWLELRMPTGEVAFRAEDSVTSPAADVVINQVCDGLCSPEWGARRVGDMCGTVLLELVS